MPVQLPVIDFSTVKNGTIKDRREVALKIDDALRSAGAFYLRNFDIPRTRIDECFEMVGVSLHARNNSFDKDQECEIFRFSGH